MMLTQRSSHWPTARPGTLLIGTPRAKAAPSQAQLAIAYPKGGHVAGVPSAVLAGGRSSVGLPVLPEPDRKLAERLAALRQRLRAAKKTRKAVVARPRVSASSSPLRGTESLSTGATAAAAEARGCRQCGKRLAWTGGFVCRCGATFCHRHRLPEDHQPCASSSAD